MTEATKAPTKADIQAQLAEAEKELAEKQALEQQLADVRGKLAQVTTVQNGRGLVPLEPMPGDEEGWKRFKSTTSDLGKIAERHEELADSVEAFSPKPVTLKTYTVQDRAGASPGVYVEGCIDSQEAVRIYFAAYDIPATSVKVKVKEVREEPLAA